MLNPSAHIMVVLCWCLSHVAHLQTVKPTQVGKKDEGFELGKDLLAVVKLASSSSATL